MDTLKYLQAQSGLVQDFLQKEDEDNAKNEDTVLRDDTLGSLGLPASADVLKSSLTTDAMKNAIKNALKTGDDDVDSAVGAVIDGEKNPLDAVEKLLGRKVSDAVQQVKAKLPEGADGADTPLDSVKNAVSSFFKNPEEIQSTLRTGLSQLKAGVQGQLTDVMNNPSGTLENVVSNPSGALDSVMDTSRGVLGQVKEGLLDRARGALQDAKNVFNDIKGNLPQPRGAGAIDDEFGDDTLMQDASDFRVSSFLKNPAQKMISREELPFPEAESRDFVPLDEPLFSSVRDPVTNKIYTQDNRPPPAQPAKEDNTIENPQDAEQPKAQDGDGDIEAPKQTASTDDADVPQGDSDLAVPAEPASEGATDVATAGADVADATDAVDAVSAGLDADPITAPIGILVGLGSLIGSVFGMAHHKVASVDPSSIGSAIFTAGI